ncbi:uncharacterized protein LOC105018877 isoform X2 [Esox lucius]|uniref:uncharacterized protein LOC105018877 isoform X2 n=1 Tax=Esox lucius TaxID=8010 RepID=UPI000578131D|nr:uncharacterized protein LOC105018877 isoform X2 [Esox lucius]
MYRRLLSLWVTGALLMPLCWANEEDHKDEYEDISPTPDYDFTATFDYGFHTNEVDHKDEYEDSSPTPDYDYLATYDYDNSSNEIDYNKYAVLGIENKAFGIGSSFSVLLLGLAANQLYQLL